MTRPSPLVGLIMGSQSDWATMKAAAEILDALGIPIESAHRLGPPHAGSPLCLCQGSAEGRGLKVIIAGAGGAAHLPGMTASMTDAARARRAGRKSKALKGLDSLLSIVQMPGGVPVGDLRHRRGGREERRPPCRRDPGAGRCGASPSGSPPGARGRPDSVAETPSDTANAMSSCPPLRRGERSAFSAAASWAACWRWQRPGSVSRPISIPTRPMRPPFRCRPRQHLRTL